MKIAILLFVLAIFIIAARPSWPSEPHSGSGLYAIPVFNVEHQKTDLSAYRNKVLLVVNTASQCGYTPQYEGLEKLYTKYRHRGLVVLAFPSNDFGSQEPGSNTEIKRFCKLKYHVDFPIFSKDAVTGEKIQPLYAWLIQHAPTHEAIGWNFEKFLIDRSGKIVGRFKSGIEPDADEFQKAVEKYVNESS